jgi:hypothetical protein
MEVDWDPVKIVTERDGFWGCWWLIYGLAEKKLKRMVRLIN